MWGAGRGSKLANLCQYAHYTIDFGMQGFEALAVTMGSVDLRLLAREVCLGEAGRCSAVLCQYAHCAPYFGEHGFGALVLSTRALTYRIIHRCILHNDAAIRGDQ